MIRNNINSVTHRITTSCEKSGRDPGSVRILCVTKTIPVANIEEAIAAGITDIGENRVQEASLKYETIGTRARWHLVGHLQTNKARDAVKIFSLIHSVDSVRLAQAIDKEAKKIDKVQDVLLEVNVSGEQSKFGLESEAVAGTLDEIRALSNVRVRGLMTVAPIVDDPEDARPYFKALRELRDSLNAARSANDKLTELSMGMTDDFEVAIQEGATMVRIGRAIFGERG